MLQTGNYTAPNLASKISRAEVFRLIPDELLAVAILYRGGPDH